MKSKTGNATVDATMLAAESTRQSVVNVAGVSQATANTATIVYYRALLAANLAAGLDAGSEIAALKSLGATI
jgi:hypothetical protein